MSLKDFVNLAKIGEGSYSSVHKVRRISDNVEYALKKVKLGGLSEKEKDNALNEVRILASIAHPNMIAYKDAFFDESSHSLCIIMELAQNGDLQKKIDNAKKRNVLIGEEEIWTIALHMLRGLKAMHSKKILHRDLKCANVFISKSDEYKLGDLNVSKVAKRGLVYTQTGTPYYASPEVWRDEPYDSSSDIWSFGCIIYELAALNPPFRAKDMEGLFKKVQKGIFERLPAKYSQDLQKFVSLCLQVSSVQRPSVTQLLNNGLLKKNTQFLAESEEDQIDKENTQRPEDLLDTIKMPKNPRQLKEKLPKSQYAKEVMNNSLDSQLLNYQRASAHQRNPSLKMNRIQSVTTHRQQQHQQQSSMEEENNDRVLPLIGKHHALPPQNQKIQADYLLPIPSPHINERNNVRNPGGMNRYDNPSSIVSDSRQYLQEQELQQQQNKRRQQSANIFQEDTYMQKNQRQVLSPTISVISKKDTGFQQLQAGGGVLGLKGKVNSINHINSYARIANLYQKTPALGYEVSNHSNGSHSQVAKPVWWG